MSRFELLWLLFWGAMAFSTGLNILLYMIMKDI